MQFMSKPLALLVALASASVTASPILVKNDALKPTLTTQTFTFTGTKVYDTIVSYSPFWLTATETFLWTQTATNLIYPTPTPNA
ncbi:hypothetical protein CVT25_005941 [Psilocybe cyanescens]|uniref:Uncharacterized protein n=1 Tax=Psilocybe cyanescens TaxID=93625 RepID=A0A409VSP6_PSICY|nr:hypothetical protein CVT25_005941 [Psilocybe cyanescens]